MPSALGGLKVLDFSRVLAGPLATMVLGDLGAEVTKVEAPAGDDTRQWGPPYDEAGDATYFQAVNRNKQSVILDLTDPADLSRAMRLASEADVVVENFRPGVTKRFGLDYESLRETNPGLIYCSITGFGAGKLHHYGKSDRQIVSKSAETLGLCRGWLSQKLSHGTPAWDNCFQPKIATEQP